MQNASQANAESAFVNNLPLNPTIEDFNRLASQSWPGQSEVGGDEPLFGTHIREAIAVMKRWKNGK